MPRIIPIRDLCKTAQISEMCKNTEDPIYVTKNGYADMVIMSAAVYEMKMMKTEIYEKIAQGIAAGERGEVVDGQTAMKELRRKYVK